MLADPTQLAQVFQNLISNGIKFHSDRPPEIHVTKPVDFDQFIKIVRSIEEFWLTIVKLPSE